LFGNGDGYGEGDAVGVGIEDGKGEDS